MNHYVELHVHLANQLLYILDANLTGRNDRYYQPNYYQVKPFDLTFHSLAKMVDNNRGLSRENLLRSA